MTGPLLLALDQGTTSTRAVLYDLRGREVATQGARLLASWTALKVSARVICPIRTKSSLVAALPAKFGAKCW